MIYDYIKTAFGVLVGILTHSTLLTIALIALGLFIAWVILSLIFSFEKKFDKNTRKILSEIQENGIKESNKSKFDQLIKTMPSAFVRGWNSFKYNSKGLPSEYIKREDSLDLELSGGLFKRNRSIMRTAIYTVFTFLLLCTIAMLGNEDVLTGYRLAESALIPIIFLGLARITYYIYTAIRQYQYRVAVDGFHELLKALDESVLNKASDIDKEVEINQEKIEEFVISADNEGENSLNGEVEENTLQENEENKQEEKPLTKKRGRPKLENLNGDSIVIRTDKEFEVALERAEKLMRKSEQQLSQAQAKRVEKNLKQLIDAMNKYREGEE